MGGSRCQRVASGPGLFTISVVVLALCLAVAIYGLVLFLIGGRGLDFYTFAFVSLLAMAVHFPRLAQWEEWAKVPRAVS